jgi:4-carboxymuconolactone decarboxylase
MMIISMDRSLPVTEGSGRRARAQGPRTEDLIEVNRAMDPQLPDWVDGFIFGEVWGRPGLAHEERMLVAISSLATSGHQAQLRNYLFGALHDGISARKIHETLVQLCVYAGFPVMLDALVAWGEVVASARRQGLTLDLED